jgi:hypothetical protein
MFTLYSRASARTTDLLPVAITIYVLGLYCRLYVLANHDDDDDDDVCYDKTKPYPSLLYIFLLLFIPFIDAS